MVDVLFRQTNRTHVWDVRQDNFKAVPRTWAREEERGAHLSQMGWLEVEGIVGRVGQVGRELDRE